jgi:hypothetical protein
MRVVAQSVLRAVEKATEGALEGYYRCLPVYSTPPPAYALKTHKIEAQPRFFPSITHSEPVSINYRVSAHTLPGRKIWHRSVAWK